ncbi:MAG: hypothetical protein LBF94_02780 [Puniceicoccales bacterium]|jgi:hypothetical protein|nr:hypothetical protein [Puniceicoccales bacterium]
MNKNTTINIYLDTRGDYNVVEIKLGEFSLNVAGNDRYLTECLNNGYCDVDLPNNAFDVMFKHKLFKLRRNTNPEIMRVLEDVFVRHDEKEFLDTPIQTRKVLQLELKQDKTIPGLLNDPDFQRLNPENDSRQKPNNDRVITVSR